MSPFNHSPSGSLYWLPQKLYIQISLPVTYNSLIFKLKEEVSKLPAGSWVMLPAQERQVVVYNRTTYCIKSKLNKITSAFRHWLTDAFFSCRLNFLPIVKCQIVMFCVTVLLNQFMLSTIGRRFTKLVSVLL